MTRNSRTANHLIGLLCAILCAYVSGNCCAHDFHAHLPTQNSEFDTAKQDSATASDYRYQAASSDAFKAFEPQVNTFLQGDYLVIESDGLPSHGMMVGIRAWQQQVPLPQPFRSENAWRLPLNPKPAAQPISVMQEPLRGAIALAVNGVPIFCALNNRGEDTLLAGELDQWGGHCGRGDDYHYHVAPLHLEPKVGIGRPIAFALDGYPIIGLNEADGSLPQDLDSFNGHEHNGLYHYHASRTFPYVNGGLYGQVQMSGDQIDQPRDSPARPGQPPLRGATITDFTRSGNQFELTYDLAGEPAKIRYELLDDQRVRFDYIQADKSVVTETYTRGSPSSQPGFPAWFALTAVACCVLVALTIRGLTLKRTK